jgi:hypothetical protein
VTLSESGKAGPESIATALSNLAPSRITAHQVLMDSGLTRFARAPE